MYYMGQDVKGKEGAASLYSNQGQGLNGTDKTMTSSEVAAAVSVPKPSKERLPSASQTAVQGQ
ncbi:hypothetical protein CPB83DRAFT_860271 [Crepidotus variabilis]|uniref:Uncharacterized protein n=1 Tax=Crepidotus variabilis TaxID=179855 RepID=A0A9P6E9Z2_9AGAR|nr:hypothetical protein CPB83DRAFT_860271 [Crepidotus variabilis]